MALQRPIPSQQRRAMAVKLREAADFRVGAEDQPQRIRESEFRYFLEALAQLVGDPKYQRFYVGLAPVDALDSTFTLTAAAPSQEYLPQRLSRQYLLICNVGANDVRISFGHPVTTTTGIVLPANGFYEPIRPLTSSVNMLSVAGSTVAVVEG